jgi:hypothetical protein
MDAEENVDPLNDLIPFINEGVVIPIISNSLRWERYFPEQEYRKTCEQWPLEPEAIPTAIQTQIIETLPDVTTVNTATASPTPTAIADGTAPALFRVVNVTEEDRLNIRAGRAWDSDNRRWCSGRKYDLGANYLQ